MSAEAAKAKIESWLVPVSDASPAGEDARYEPLHAEIRAEAAKLESPATDLPNWEKLIADARRLTIERSKDLLIESYAAYGLYQTEGLLGLTAGLFLLAESMDRYWDQMFPVTERVKARVNAVRWLTERLEPTLSDTPVGVNDHDAVEGLEAAFERLRGVVAEKFAEQAPALRPIADAIERLKLSLPERPDAQAAAVTDDGAQIPAEQVPDPPPNGAPPAGAVSPASTPDPGSAPATVGAVDLDGELAALAAEWVQPISGDRPAGIDAKYEVEVEALRNDVMALESPAGGTLEWEQGVLRAGKVLKETSKDLLIASYLAYGLWETRGLEGLAVGLEVLTQICDQYWDACFPPVKRLRGRVNALSWLLDKLEAPLSEVRLTADDERAVARLERACERFSAQIREKFVDSAPAIRPLTDNIQRLKLSLPVAAPDEPPPPAPTPSTRGAPRPPAPPAKAAAAAEPMASQSVSLAASGATLADPAEVGKFSREVAKSLIQASKTLRGAAAADVNGYLFLRLGVFLTAKSPPAQGTVTQVPAPQEQEIKDFEAQVTKESWESLLTMAEAGIAMRPFWLDLHRYSALALQHLGSDYESARDCVLAAAAFYVKRFPGLIDYTFQNGSPFASEPTKVWLRSEVLPSSADAGTGGGGDGEGEGAGVLSEARSLAAGGKIDEALSRLEALAHGARSGRARFKARLVMAEMLSSGRTAAVAEGIFDALGTELEHLGLEEWEPELAAECYRGHFACLKGLQTKGNTNDPAVARQLALAYRRLCRVDPVGALKAGPSSR